MKSYGNLWPKMVDHDNVVTAIMAAAKGKRHKRSVKEALADVDAYADKVVGLLEADQWRPPKVRKGYYVEDGIIRKRRLIVHPDFMDLVVQHLLVDFVLRPIFEPTFYRWSCGSIPGRGQESLSKYIMRRMRGGRFNKPGKVLSEQFASGTRTFYRSRRPERPKARYHAVADIRKCFGTLDIVETYAYISARLRDARVKQILWLVLDSNAIEVPHKAGEEAVIQKRGVPIGMYASPWFVNIILNIVDHQVKDVGAMYVFGRFIDDMLLAGANVRKIKRCIDEIEGILDRFGMRLKSRPVVLDFTKPDGRKVRFTGFQFTVDDIVVRDQVFLRARRKGARLIRKMRRSGRRNRVTAHDASAMISYGGRFKAFERRHAFTTQVLRSGKIKFGYLRKKVSARDLKANEQKEVSCQSNS